MKQQLSAEMTENGIHYTLHGEYYLPDTRRLVFYCHY